MAKTRRNRTHRGGQKQGKSSTSYTSLGGRSRKRRGGQYGPAPVTTNASNLFEDIGTGAQKALDKTKEGMNWALNKVFPGTATSNPPAQSYAVGGRRKRRGGNVNGYTSFKSVPASVNAKGGSRRKRRGGGEVVGFDENWKEYGSVGGSRRRRRKH